MEYQQVSRVTNPEVLAALWLIRREDPAWTPDDNRELHEWLECDFSHKAAFWRLEHGWQKADAVADSANADDAADGESILLRIRRSRSLVIAATVALAVCGSAAFLLRPMALDPPRQDYFQTAVGEQKTVALEEGSLLEINTGSRLHTRLSDERRDVWLADGEAVFQVSKRNGVPFIVHAGGQTITVLGTTFAVRNLDGEVTVSVIEGRVALGDASGKLLSQHSVLSAGEMSVSQSGNTLIMLNAGSKIETATAWRNGVLVFDNATLAEAVQEFRRYDDRDVVFEDNAVSQIAVGGRFKADNFDGFLNLLGGAYGIQVVEVAGTVRISSP